MTVKPRKPAIPKFVIVVFILTGAAAITHLLPLLNAPLDGARFANQVSLQLDGWSGTERPIDEHTAAILETEDVVDRRYNKPDESWVDLTIIFAKEQRKVAHPQEVCLKGSGYNVQHYSRPSVPTGITDPAYIPVVRLKIEKGNNRHLVYYFYKCGPHYSASYYWENILIMWSRVTLRPANGALIKLTTSIDTDEPTAEDRLQRFLAVALPEIAGKLP